MIALSVSISVKEYVFRQKNTANFTYALMGSALLIMNQVKDLEVVVDRSQIGRISGVGWLKETLVNKSEEQYRRWHQGLTRLSTGQGPALSSQLLNPQ